MLLLGWLAAGAAAVLLQYWCPDARGLLIGSPANPTGAVYSDRELLELIRFIEANSGFLLSDEVYQGINFYPEDWFTALNVSSEIFVINSFSKLFGMTGWRLGWIVAPQSACSDLLKLAQNFFICAPSISQHAAIAAFSNETKAIIEDQADTLRERKEFLVKALRSLGFRIDAPPRGAYYVYAELPKTPFVPRSFVTDSWRRNSLP